MTSSKRPVEPAAADYEARVRGRAALTWRSPASRAPPCPSLPSPSCGNRRAVKGPPRISPTEAASLLRDGWAYVDVRPPEEFADGHPEGAFNVPVDFELVEGRAPNEEFLAVMRAAFPASARLVVGCKAGRASMRAARLLTEAGYAHVVEQRAGWDGARGTFGERVEDGWAQLALPRATGDDDERGWDALRRRRIETP